jgi:hypothetical protein
MANKISADQIKQERQWQVESAMSTLKRAEEIRKDTKLMSEVKKSAQALVKSVGIKTGTPSRTTKRK